MARLPFFSLHNADPEILKTINHEVRAGIRFAGLLRVVVVGLIALLLTLTIDADRLWYWWALCAGFMLFGLIPLLMVNRVKNPIALQAVFAALDAILLVVMLLVPDPQLDGTFPVQFGLRFHNHLYLFVLLSGSVFSYSPILVLWTGFCLSAAWGVGFAIIAQLESSFGDVPQWINEQQAQGREATLVDAIMQPGFVNYFQLINVIALLMITSLVLAGAVYRQRRNLLRQVDAERDRQNLSRYFSPNIIQRLTKTSDPFKLVKKHPVGVIYADLVGFTQLCSEREPQEVISLIRRFHSDMAEVIFAHGGTLDKYIGDAVMATFGTPEQRPDDAIRTLACARKMREKVVTWAEEIHEAGGTPLQVGIGAHFGEAVIGNVGDNRRLEFTAIGDAVNVASRLEGLKHELSAEIVLSEDLIIAAQKAGAQDHLFDGLEQKPDVSLRGRSEPMTLFRLPR